MGNKRSEIRCLLCQAQVKTFEFSNRKYHQCVSCSALFLDPLHRLSPEAEKARYLKHNNDVDDVSYQKFVSPIVAGIQQKFDPKVHHGLDFGAGTGPVVAKCLRDQGYHIELYDPFFWNDSSKLEDTYDFIICCEVIEHFYSPSREFKLLKSLLKPGGILFCMTELYTDNIDFKSWHYRNDSTHVFFYHRNTLEWIKNNFCFSSCEVQGRLIQFSL